MDKHGFVIVKATIIVENMDSTQDNIEVIMKVSMVNISDCEY